MSDEPEELEGKDGDSIYSSRQSPDWKKVINWSSTNVYIVGYRKCT
jgi:hypothetical protein